MIKCYWADKEIDFKPFKYPAGEVGYKIEAVPNKIVCHYEGSDDFVLLLMLHLHFPQARIVVPYMPFGREDRRVADNASYGLELMYEMFCTKLITFDVHSSSGRIKNIKADKLIEKVIELVNPDLLAFPDEGAYGRYHNNSLPMMFGKKVRDIQTGDIIEYMLETPGLIAKADNSKILVIDDICDGGRTFIELAKLLPDDELYLYVSHGIFSQGLDELKKYYKHIYTTNSYLGQRDPEFVTELEINL